MFAVEAGDFRGGALQCKDGTKGGEENGGVKCRLSSGESGIDEGDTGVWCGGDGGFGIWKLLAK